MENNEEMTGETIETHATVLRMGHGIGRFHVEGFVADVFCMARKGEVK